MCRTLRFAGYRIKWGVVFFLLVGSTYDIIIKKWFNLVVSESFIILPVFFLKLGSFLLQIILTIKERI